MNCPYCGGASRRRFEAKDWNQRASTRSFPYRECASCSLVFIEHVPDDLAAHYLNEQYDIPATAEGFEARAQGQHWKVDLLGRLAAPGPLLEVGPATGEFAFAARQAGYAPTLLEMDAACCRFLSERLRLPVVQTADPAACLEGPARYAAVCVWQAIEHIPAFWSLLERAAGRLAAGGVIVVSTPNPQALQARLLGRYWPHLDAPRHLYLIPRAWMRTFARQQGLEVALDTTRDPGSLGLNYYGWLVAVQNATRRKVSQSAAAALLTRRLAALFAPWEAREGAGAAYTVALRKVAR